MTSSAANVVTMSIYTVLEGEHNEVSALFKAIEATPDIATGRTTLFTKLNNELRSHSVAEQQAVYDRVKTKEGGGEMISHSESEHADIEHHLNELETMDIVSDAWLLKLTELKHVVDHHVQEEETSVFDKMHQMFTDEEARELANDFQRLKNAELKKLKAE